MDDIVLPKAVRSGSGRALSSYLIERIGSGELSVGVKLPSERDLSETFHASRGTVRKVLEAFVAQGILRRAVGSGTYVAALPEPSRFERQRKAAVTNVSPAELMEARMLFEPLLPSLIARNATPLDFARMQQCVEESEKAESFEEFEYWDGELHESFSRATHNAFIVVAMNLMTEVRETGEWGRLKYRALTPDRRTCYQVQHRDIVAALRERDEHTASRLIRAHLLEVQSNLFSVTGP